MDSTITAMSIPPTVSTPSLYLPMKKKHTILSIYLFTKHNSLQEAVSGVVVSFT